MSAAVCHRRRMAATNREKRERAEPVHISLPPSLLAELRALAAREYRPVSGEVARAIEAHVARHRTREPEERAEGAAA